EPLSAALNNPVVVENRPGANGSIATGAVKRAAPDGYTVLLQYSGYHVITPAIVSNLGWDPIEDFVAVANVISAPQLVVVRDGLPVKTLPELIAYAKANPGKLSYASSGNGSLQHVTGELLKQLAGIEMTHVPYKGTGPAINDLIGGSVDLTFGTPPPFMGHIESGRLRPLAVTGPQRLPSLPDTPTAAEAGLPKLDASSWFGMFAPRDTPPAVVERLTSEIARIVRDPEFVKKAELQGATASYMDPKEFASFTKAELDRWATVVKSAGIKAD
ncbi:MAG TPA: tripartite tricarboxylate transporter substrate binding protein, partial [Burkholderiaceae bacterium]|nr:tripartite tricarboxylate transporter substrate binding protein [Burkholderiaceae bacterium]